MMFDIIIQGGLVIDGTGTKPQQIDIGITRDTITAIGGIDGAEAAETVDARGLHVCPGFIDSHSHSDFNILIEPAGQAKVQQGVTTEVCGNCGMSSAPLYGMARRQRAQGLKTLGIDIAWSTLPEFAWLLRQKKLLCNILPLIGHGNIRGSVIGYDDQLPDAATLQRMSDMLDAELRAGAWGLSTGLIYPPGVYAKTPELISLCRVAGRRGGLYTTHMRSEGDRLLEAITEAISICRDAEIPVQISHLKTMGRQNWHKLPRVFEMIEKARAEGLPLSADRYPYTAGSTDLDAVLPAWVCQGGADAELERLRSPVIREQLSGDLRRSERGLADEILISRVASEKNKHLEGMLLGQAAESRNQSVTDALLSILIEEALHVDAIFFSMSEDNLREILKKDYVMIGSDASVWDITGPLSAGKPHPRGFGTFPRVIRKYVLEERVLGLEQAVRKMTGQVAATLGIPDRGLIRTGHKADIVMLDLANIKDNATYEEPHRFPSGISRVMVNGQWIVHNQTLTAARPGRLLLKQ